MTHTADFTSADWKRISETWQTWWDGSLERPIIIIEAYEASSGFSFIHLYPNLTQYGLDTPIEQILNTVQIVLDSVHWMGDALPRWYPNFGPGILAGCLGSHVKFANGTTWFEPLKEADVSDIGAFQPAIDWNNPWWQRVEAVTHAAVERWGDHLCVGITDLGGNLDILASLCGSESLLTAMVEMPNEVMRLTGQITSIWLECFKRLCTMSIQQHGCCGWAPLWMPQAGYMLQSDLSYMISPRMFTKYALPDLVACCQSMPYGFYHLDGKGEIPHLKSILEIPNLKGIQWIPGEGAPPPEEWLDLLGGIRSAGKLCQLYVTPKGAQKIIQALGGKGFAFYLWEEADHLGHRDLTPQEGDAALALLEKEGVSI